MAATKQKRTGSLTEAKRRAMALARTGLGDDEILSVLRAEFSTESPVRVIRTRLDEAMGGWKRQGWLDDARVAGRAYVLEAMHKAVEGVAVPVKRDGDEFWEQVPTRDSVNAATQLLKRQEHLEGLEASVKKELERLMGLDSRELAEELSKLRGRMGL